MPQKWCEHRHKTKQSARSNHQGHLPAWLCLPAAIIVLLISMVVALGIGSVQIPAMDVVHVIARRLSLVAGNNVTVLDDQIVWQLRMPRILAAVSTGAVLAVCGAVLQTLTGNALADPYLLGISSGASVGAVIVLVMGISVGLSQTSMMMSAAFIGALVAIGLVLALSVNRDRQLPPSRTVLAGVAVAQMCAALTSLMVMVFGSNNTARAAMEWMLGSFAGSRWSSATVLATAGCLTLVIALFQARPLDAFSFGDIAASSLGISVARTRWISMVVTALMTAVTVSFVGPIGFVGLTVPHIVRLVSGPRHAIVIPFSAVCGGLLLLWSDTAARSVTGNSEIPVGVVTAIIGTPLLAILLRKQAA